MELDGIKLRNFFGTGDIPNVQIEGQAASGLSLSNAGLDTGKDDAP
jgi:hypothetical protein